MTSERTQAYGRVIHLLADIGPVKLHAAEVVRIREAVDTLLFAADAGRESGVAEATADVRALVAHLVEADRWTTPRANELVRDVLACGPLVAATAA